MPYAYSKPSLERIEGNNSLERFEDCLEDLSSLKNSNRFNYFEDVVSD